MLIHHLNCVSACPLGGQLLDGFSGARLRGRLSSHCLLLECAAHLVLVDTGFGLRDVREPRTRLSKILLAMNKPLFREEMTAIRQIERMGFDPRDVRHVVLTHLDFDHAGGLDDFPWATVHMLRAERAAAEAQRTVLDRVRYRPAQWGSRARWRTYEPSAAAPWLGVPCVRGLDGVAAEIVLVPLLGHTLGHAGVAVQREDGGWLLLAGDAYFHYAEMDLERPSCPVGLRLYQTLMQKDRHARLASQHRLRTLLHECGAELQIVCSHDVREFEECAGRPVETLPPLVRKTREGLSILDEGVPDAAPPSEEGTLPGVVIVRPARDHGHRPFRH